MEVKRPKSRDKGEAKEGKGVFKRGEGTGQGPVGTGQGPRVSQTAEELGRKAQEEFRRKAEELRKPGAEAKDDEAQNATRGLGLGDILDAAMGNNGQHGNQVGNQGSIYQNMTPQQQQQLQQQLAQQLQAQQAQQAHQAQQAQQAHQAQQAQHHQSVNSNTIGQGYGSGHGSSAGGNSGGKSRLGCLIAILFLVLFFFILRPMFFGGNTNNNNTSNNTNTSTTTNTPSTSTDSNTTSNSSGSGSSSYGFGGTGGASLFGGNSSTGTSVAAGSGYSSGWQLTSNNGVLNNEIASGARDKYTNILGNGQDEVTILLYLCGTDLESRYGMATNDLQEMLAAKLSEKVKIVIFTGGCRSWRNDVMSSSVNEIYLITHEGLSRLNSNAGTAAMTDPDNLEAFIKWGAANYPANRMCLILWDHGGGSVSGYGYDEKYARSGAMSLTQLNKALDGAGVKFDFIGFDACLMATAETGLMAGKFADYMIASEEVEPGIGWYYTDWLTALSQNTSMPTVEIGKNIIDTYTTACQRSAPGQATTLSITDLAELQATLPTALAAFSKETADAIDAGKYQSVAKARTSSTEFSRSSQIDQIDLAHFATLLGTESGKKLAYALTNAVKYNRTSKSMTNAYGLSIYFPYRRLSSIDTMTNAYSQIGIDSSLGACIAKFAQYQAAGQASSGGSYSPFWTLSNSNGSGSWNSGSNYGSGYGSNTGSYGGTISSSDLEALLGALFGGGAAYDSYGIYGTGGRSLDFMTEDVDLDKMATYLEENMMNAEDFVWKENKEGYASIQLSEEQWAKIASVEMSMFYDDGEGYIDLGLDNIFDVDEEGNLLPVVDNSWISIDGQPVAYYHMSTFEDPKTGDYTIIGRVPVLYTGKDDQEAQRADLILVFDQDKPEGYISGIRFTYTEEQEVDVIAKTQEVLEEGDKLDFLCDYYGYDGSFQDSYYIGEQFTVTDPENIEISNTIVGDDILVTYKFVDMFGETYWTPAL